MSTDQTTKKDMLYGILNQVFDKTVSLFFLLNIYAKIELLKMLKLHQQGNKQAFFFYTFQNLKIYCKLNMQTILLILLQSSVFGGSFSSRVPCVTDVVMIWTY